jgi:hypothetical protein
LDANNWETLTSSTAKYVRHDRLIHVNAELLGVEAAAVPARGVDPTIALASTLHASATTAVLLGSGISSSANILTGWGVTLDLIRRYAKAHGVASDVGDPVAWWETETGKDARYDQVLPALAPTDGARRDLLRTYFEKDTAGQPIHPTSAHHALATLAARGRVPVIITTNFDRLMERALQAEGVAAQILTRPGDVKGMTPIQHASVTVVKLHGDYAGGPLRNNADELHTYQHGWRRLLARVFDEYGLLVVGWSGEYDQALARAMTKSVGRRYAWYWATYRQQMTEEARTLVNGRGAHVIDTDGADEFLTGLLSRVKALDSDSTRRRGARPTSYLRQPSTQSPPPGWTDLPLVHILTVVSYRPVTFDDTGWIDARVRRTLTSALNQSCLTRFVRDVSAAHTPAAAAANKTPGAPAIMNDAVISWEASVDGYQNTHHASYGLGGSGGVGTSALAQVFCPQPGGSDEVVLTLDIGLSYVDGVSATLLTDVLHTSLMTLGADLLPVIAELVPASTPIARIEVHWDSSDVSGSLNRPVPATCKIDMGLFGKPMNPPRSAGSYAEHPPDGPLTPESAGEVIMRALETVALDSGFVDPEPGLAVIRSHLHRQLTGEANSQQPTTEAGDGNHQPCHQSDGEPDTVN